MIVYIINLDEVQVPGETVTVNTIRGPEIAVPSVGPNARKLKKKKLKIRRKIRRNLKKN